MPLLTNDSWRRMLSESIDRAMAGHGFRMVAFVYMPEHVHILTFPAGREAHIDRLLKAIKRPFSFRIEQQLIETGSSLLDRLTVRERPGKNVFRFWQEGGGYDRNLVSADTVEAAINYIHTNPAGRGLCERAADWKWSSCRHYQQDRRPHDQDLPAIHGLPAEFFT